MRLGQRLLKGCGNGGEVNQGRLLTLANGTFSMFGRHQDAQYHLLGPFPPSPAWVLMSLRLVRMAVETSWNLYINGLLTLQWDPSKPLVCEKNEEWRYSILFSRYQHFMLSSHGFWACEAKVTGAGSTCLTNEVVQLWHLFSLLLLLQTASFSFGVHQDKFKFLSSTCFRV